MILDLILIALVCVSLYTENKAFQKLDQMEQRLDAVERGEFDDYGKEVDDD